MTGGGACAEGRKGLAMALHDLSPPFLRKVSRHQVGLLIQSDWPCLLRWAPDGEEEFLPCRPARAPAGYLGKWWKITLRPEESVLRYRFRLLSQPCPSWLSSTGVSRVQPMDDVDFAINLEDPGLDWLSGQVFYQIFPDRFCSSRQRVAPHHQVDGQPALLRKWGQRPDRKCGWREFYGGDLPGIQGRLDYLQHLGVSGIYLNPIFRAPSNHRYDCASYEEVDPHLGGQAAFSSLRAALFQRTMRLILDVVPNHCGHTHPWFESALKGGPEREFFTFHEPTKSPAYECWKGHTTLPKLNYQSQSLRDRMYRDPDSVLQRWLAPPHRLDGWRLDVANMWGRQGPTQIQAEVLREMRRHLKAVAPHAYLLGENFFDATSQLQGDQLDGCMNYRGWLFPLLNWLKGQLSGADFWQEWRQVQAHLSKPQRHQQWNLLGSHDTPRIASQLPQSQRESAFVALMTFPGVPCLYYGDEVPLQGGADPANRACMPWPVPSSDWWHWIQALISLRRSLPWLQKGALYAWSDLTQGLVYARIWDQQILLVALQVAAPFQLDLSPLCLAPGGQWKGWPSEVQAGDHLGLEIPKSNWQIWRWNC